MGAWHPKSLGGWRDGDEDADSWEAIMEQEADDPFLKFPELCRV